ncbi:ent-kaur-16-ene synthase, chloroplastic-like [Canna indica]|uniref:Ent-kaur-16-ene synthase, chloroplastic-like n=1 Tax=Canna indica TaxID=4628 RepID=A0AAQ3KWI6_9LILI|nr:ent-kaur-16-ene synthase, chloroplastic-like [Canna indica]
MHGLQYPNGSIERIKEQFQKIQLSPSSYDTAWVAMVPSPVSSKNPCFPDCVDWILENQHSDGSWGLHHSHPSLIKDGLSSTLACILALQRWKAGQKNVKKGLDYIESNSSHLMDEQLWSPIGYDIIFPGMLEHATSLGVNIPLDQSKIDTMLWKRDAKLRELHGSNSEGRKAYLAYVGEGLVGNSKRWKEFMKYQRKNGSLFNSPSTTAAALMHQYDAKAHHYLHSLLSNFGGSVPTAYPLDVHTHLRTVDMVEKLGIARHFEDEIRSVLDRIYGCWLMNDEEIFLDPTTLAMAFRILRMNGYNISSDCLKQLSDVNYFDSTLQGYLKDVNAVLELNKASQVKILPNEHHLDELGSWSREFLKQVLDSNQKLGPDVSLQEVEYVLSFPSWSNLDRLVHKRHIENFNPGNQGFLKTSYKCYTINDNDILGFAQDDFNTCQSIYREELQNLENWVKENKLDQLGFARQKQTYCYFSAAAMLFSPEISDARISWAKNCILTILVDDFFDVGGSREELVNLISLVEKRDVNWEKEACSSEQVKIIFSSLFNTINELGTKASALQKRSITHHLVDIRECEDGKLNGLPLRIFHSHGSTSEEEAKQEMQRVIDSNRTELLRMVLQQDGSVIPRPCKDLFWKMCRVLHLFYMKNDGLTSPTEMVGAVNAVVHEAVKVD